MNFNLRALVGKLNHETKAAVEAAAGLCLGRTHYDVEIEHYLMKLLDRNDGDFAAILKHYGVDRSRLASELTRSLDRLKSGNARNPSLSPSLIRMLSEAWSIGSLNYGGTSVRTGYTVVALASDEELSRLMRDVSKEFQKIPPDALRNDFAPSWPGRSRRRARRTAGLPEGEPRKMGGKTPNLDQYTVNLTERAKQGKIDPVLGRDFEVRQVVDILTRRRQNNPILVGEAGVGKTAVVEGFAMRIADGDVPAAAQERHPPDPRPGAAPGGRGREGRVREPSQGAHRGGAVLGRRPSSCSSTRRTR